MDISKISESYSLKDIYTYPDQLLLDPNNPRISFDIDEKLNYTDSQLLSNKIQDYVLSVINKSAYHIADLIKGFRTAGFLRGGSPIIVRHIEDNKYLLVEGNRRLTAIKYLLKEKDELNPTILKTLQKLKVQEFIYDNSSHISEEEAIDILLGTIHIKGPLQWGPIEKALYIHKAYMRELKKIFDENIDFFYVKSIAEDIAKFFNHKLNEIKYFLMIYRVYDQLKFNEYPVMQGHYTLIELAVRNSLLSKDFFGLDQHFNFSMTGLENFANLCICDNRPITNPLLFKSFFKIYKNGTPHEVSLIVEHEASIERTLKKVNNRLEKKKFSKQLDKIQALLEDLVITDYQFTNHEKETIREIRDLVKHRLSYLLR